MEIAKDSRISYQIKSCFLSMK